MARRSRIQSTQGIYHVILRGINKQQIFECSEDYEHFVRILQRQCGLPVLTRPSRIRAVAYSDVLDDKDYLVHRDEEELENAERHCFIYAWCLMGNHVHLLIQESDECIGDVIKRISSSYVYYYNHKYERIGHLFQERFKSQPVESWDYFLTLLRYIHQNPLKPHMVEDLKDYQWSSWNEYMGCCDTPFCSKEFVLDRISLEELTDLVYKPLEDIEEDDLLDIDLKPNPKNSDDAGVWEIIESYCGATNSSEFQYLPRPLQKHVLYCVHEEGVGPRTLSRLTGVPYSIVQRATSAKNEWLLAQHRNVMCEESDDDEYLTYCGEDELEKYPEY